MTAVQRGAIVQAFATLGLGSAFFHASQTALGETFDTALIDLLAYDMWQTYPIPAFVFLHVITATTPPPAQLYLVPIIDNHGICLKWVNMALLFGSY